MNRLSPPDSNKGGGVYTAVNLYAALQYFLGSVRAAESTE